MKQIFGWALIVFGAVSALHGIGIIIEKEEGNGVAFIISGIVAILAGVCLKKKPVTPDDDNTPVQDV